MKANNHYLEEDQDLITELDSIGPLSTGAALEEQKRKIEVINIKAILRGRKAAADTEQSNTRFSNVILIFTVVQVVIGFFQFIFSIITTEKNSVEQWVGIIYMFLLIGFMGYLLKLIKIDK